MLTPCYLSASGSKKDLLINFHRQPCIPIIIKVKTAFLTMGKNAWYVTSSFSIRLIKSAEVPESGNQQLHSQCSPLYQLPMGYKSLQQLVNIWNFLQKNKIKHLDKAVQTETHVASRLEWSMMSCASRQAVTKFSSCLTEKLSLKLGVAKLGQGFHKLL